MAGYAPAPEMRAMTELPAAIEKLQGRDREFAQSLLTSAKEYGKLSEKQMIWVDKLIEKANEPVDTSEGEFAAIVAQLGKAKGKLKAPKVMIACGKLTIKLAVAKEHTRVPGSINVACGQDWYGRILENGRFQTTGSSKPAPEGLMEALAAYAKDPKGVSQEYGMATHHCCYCAKELTDQRSKDAGYGPDCASHYSLPWGDRPATNGDTP